MSRRSRTYVDGAHMATAEQKAFLNEREVADLLTVDPRTIQRWRVSGEGPPYVRAGPEAYHIRPKSSRGVGADAHVSPLRRRAGSGRSLQWGSQSAEL